MICFSQNPQSFKIVASISPISSATNQLPVNLVAGAERKLSLRAPIDAFSRRQVVRVFRLTVQHNVNNKLLRIVGSRKLCVYVTQTILLVIVSKHERGAVADIVGYLFVINSWKGTTRSRAQ